MNTDDHVCKINIQSKITTCILMVTLQEPLKMESNG